MINFSNNQSFKSYLSGKRKEIYQITSDSVLETYNFKRLLSIFTECRRKNEESDFRLILISKDDLSNLCEDANDKANELFKQPEFLTNRIIYVNSDLTVLNSNNDPYPENNDARRFFESLSLGPEGFVVFHISPNATINYFVDGEDYGDGIFYTLEAQSHYEEKKTIEHIDEILDDYRVHLTHQDTYLKFFVDKTGLRALHTLMKSTEKEDVFISKHKHVLKNKPEYIFHEDIRNYIKQHMKIVVYREVMLEDLDRLDIELIDDRGNDLYFIEIKWVGESIGPAGNSIPTKFDAQTRIKPDAVKQVVGYIAELLKENQNVKYGYLAVFDARKDDLPDTGLGITEKDVPEELRKYYPRFKKFDDFRVKNENPR